MQENTDAINIPSNKMQTVVTQVTDMYMPMIQNQLEGYFINFDSYAKSCIISAIAEMNNILDSNGKSWGDTRLNKSNIGDVLMNIAMLRLNAASRPREIFFQLDNVKSKDKKMTIRLGIEGDGNDALLRNFGSNVKTVHPYWVVQEDDEFKYPVYMGLETSPPEWLQVDLARLFELCIQLHTITVRQRIT